MAATMVSELLGLLGGRGKRGRRGFKLGRGRCKRAHQFADHGFELHRGGADPLSARQVDRLVGIGSVIRCPLGEKRLLESLKRSSNPADLRRFALVGNLDGQFALGQLPRWGSGSSRCHGGYRE